MAIKLEHLAIATSGANPFGNTWARVRDEDIPAIKSQIAFLASENYPIKDIAMQLKVPYDTIYDWCAKDQAFAKAFHETSRKVRTNRLETVMFDQATNGVQDVIVNSGRVVMDPNDVTKPLMKTTFEGGQQQFIMKGNEREIYGDRVKTDGSITLRTDRANADLDAAIAAANAALEANGHGEPPGEGG